jgi:fumarate reductase flavoprotein subunit
MPDSYTTPETYDVCVCGAGSAGMPAALFAARGGARVLLIDSADVIGGTTNVSGGTLAAGGTKRQAERDIADSSEAHFHDVMRLGHDHGDPEMIRLATALAPAMLDWMVDNGFDLAPDTPQIVYRHDSYRVARTYWGVDKGMSITRLFERKLRAEPRVTIRLGTKFADLVTDAAGAVAGVVLQPPQGAAYEVRARHVVLATGGYSSNPALFAEFTHGHPLVSGANPQNTGMGIVAARRLGADMRGGARFLPKFGGIEDPPHSGRLRPADFPQLTPQTRPPWEIYVNLRGERFIAEDVPSMDSREHALLAQPQMIFWVVFDARVRREAPSLIPRWTPERWDQAFREHPSFVTADDWTALAAAMDVPAHSFLSSMAEYNAAVESGIDRLGRRHFPARLDEAPFYAVKNHGTAYTSCAGLCVDGDMRVLRADGTPIAGLYAAGEILGRELISGSGFVGGMSLTPAICFGRLIGEAIGAAIAVTRP